MCLPNGTNRALISTQSRSGSVCSSAALVASGFDAREGGHGLERARQLTRVLLDDQLGHGVDLFVSLLL